MMSQNTINCIILFRFYLIIFSIFFQWRLAVFGGCGSRLSSCFWQPAGTGYQSAGYSLRQCIQTDFWMIALSLSYFFSLYLLVIWKYFGSIAIDSHVFSHAGTAAAAVAFIRLIFDRTMNGNRGSATRRERELFSGDILYFALFENILQIHRGLITFLLIDSVCTTIPAFFPWTKFVPSGAIAVRCISIPFSSPFLSFHFIFRFLRNGRLCSFSLIIAFCFELLIIFENNSELKWDFSRSSGAHQTRNIRIGFIEQRRIHPAGAHIAQ